MRVTAATKRATRLRILKEARRLFTERGFPGVTTRDIAQAAEIATGTLFNYFSTKEAIAAGIATDDLAHAQLQFEKKHRRGESLEEDLFALIAAEIRGLRPHRTYFAPVIEAMASGQDDQSIRNAHWAIVGRILAEHDRAEAVSFITTHVYWTLYTGVLTFWSSDASPNQEDSLAILDQSLKAFVAALESLPPVRP